jgi:hypothetical protein
VDGNSFERFTVSVGPTFDVPWIYTVELTALTSDAEQQVKLGRATFVNPSWALGEYRAQPYSRDPSSEQCIRDNHRHLTEALAIESVASSDVHELMQRFDRAVGALDRGSTLPEEEESVLHWAGVALDECTEAGQETALLSENYGDMNGDRLPEVILTQTCVGDAALTPNIVRVFDGASSPASPRLVSPLIGKDDGLDPRGLQVQDAQVVNGRLIVFSEMYRPPDLDDWPTVFATDVYAWTGMAVGRAQPRTCLDKWSANVSCDL